MSASRRAEQGGAGGDHGRGHDDQAGVGREQDSSNVRTAASYADHGHQQADHEHAENGHGDEHHHHHHRHADRSGSAPSLRLFSPAGALRSVLPLRRAAARLAKHGFVVDIDESATARVQRFAGSDDVRLATLHRVADLRPGVALATRGGYGLTRLLDRIDWAAIAASVEAGTRWVGHSDVTSLQLGMLAHAGGVTWAGPLACDDFGRSSADGGVDDVTEACFLEAMEGSLEAVGFRTDAGFDGLDVSGTLWGGNLAIVNSLLGTPHFPRIDGGILFLEDVNEHPYRIERSLLQLRQAGVLDAQRAVLLGAFTGWKKSPLDKGYGLADAIDHVRSTTKTPILGGLPFGHVPTKVMLPVGQRVQLLVDRRDAFIGW
ncbi:LD-carboxypeptidase [Piscinibacter koreensis]|uniref:LD-carboxypeptidase n=1 Tax=Piscinibacter koreensis TaxID=2742824 RepID=A0A7Y6NKM7_9BURK|nr:LD-carboxypeptidase [Schlegelella koreensis]NUZ04948.1 LD-carboxypeptidase [Schlegelella koreensis]